MELPLSLRRHMIYRGVSRNMDWGGGVKGYILYKNLVNLV